jgi:hypothetical protein
VAVPPVQVWQTSLGPEIDTLTAGRRLEETVRFAGAEIRDMPLHGVDTRTL